MRPAGYRQKLTPLARWLLTRHPDRFQARELGNWRMKEQEWISELVNAFTRLTELTHEQATRYVNAAGHEYWRPHYLAGADPEDVIRQEIADWDLPEAEGNL